MTTRFRLALLGASSLAALVLSAPALGAYVPRLVISHYPAAVGTLGSTEIDVSIGLNDDATAKAQIFVPTGYSANLAIADGTQIGDVLAIVRAGALGGVPLTLTGEIRAANPAQFATVATQCTGTPTHAAVWVLILVASGQTLRVPLFIDPAAGPAAAFASYLIQVCLPSPDVPPDQGGAQFGAKLVTAQLILDGIYTTPSVAGRYVWPSVFTPYVAGTGTVNPGATVESRGVVPLPTRLALKGKWDKKKRRAVLSGSHSEAGAAAAGVNVRFYQGKTAGAAANATKSFGSARTSASGTFSKVKKILKRTFFQAVVFPRDVTAAACAGTSLAPGGCVTATIGWAFSSIVKVTPTKPPKKK